MPDRGAPADSLTAEAAFRREIAPWALLGLTLGPRRGRHRRGAHQEDLRACRRSLDREFRRGVRQRRAGALERREFRVGESRAWPRAHRPHGGSAGGLRDARRLVRPGAARARRPGVRGASILVARVVWTGLLTVRAAVWSANYPRAAIGRYTGRIVIVSSLAVAAAAALAAWTLETQRMDSRWLFGAGAAAGLLAAWLYRARARAPRVRDARRRECGGRAQPSPSASECCSRSCARIRISASTCSGWASTAAAI